MASATVRFVDGMQFIGVSESGHGVVLDAAADNDGQDTGARPTELLLASLGGCTGMDVVSILRKMQIRFMRFEISIDGERAIEYPKYFTKICVIYKIWGDVPEDKLKKAVDLSLEKYCSISNSLKPRAEISYKYQINPSA